MKSRLLTLKTGHAFKNARENGLKYVAPTFILQYSEAKDLSFGFIITRKIGGAVVRNLIRRRLKSLARAHILKQNYSGTYVFIARHRAKNASYADLEKDLLCALKGLKTSNHEST